MHTALKLATLPIAIGLGLTAAAVVLTVELVEAATHFVTAATARALNGTRHLARDLT